MYSVQSKACAMSQLDQQLAGPADRINGTTFTNLLMDCYVFGGFVLCFFGSSIWSRFLVLGHSHPFLCGRLRSALTGLATLQTVFICGILSCFRLIMRTLP